MSKKGKADHIRATVSPSLLALRSLAPWTMAAAALAVLPLHRGLLPRFPEGGVAPRSLADAWTVALLLTVGAVALVRTDSEGLVQRPLSPTSRYVAAVLQTAAMMLVALLGLAAGGILTGEELTWPAALPRLFVAVTGAWALPGRGHLLLRWLSLAAALWALPFLARAGLAASAQALVYAALGLFVHASTRPEVLERGG